MTLRLFGSEPTSVLALAGDHENSATFALGWVIERSPAFLKLIVADAIGPSWAPGEEVVIDLQRHDEHGGFTDVEVVCKDVCHIIIEAKRGWTIPGEAQLCRRESNRLKSDLLMNRTRGTAPDISLKHAMRTRGRCACAARRPSIPSARSN